MRLHTCCLALACALACASSTLAQFVFNVRSDYEVGRLPRSIAVADFDLDGKLDIAVGNSYGTPNTVTILLGHGDGTFATGVFYPVGNEFGPCNLSCADLNDDAKPDLVVANWNSNSISVLLNQGGATFPTTVNYPGGGTLSNIITTDINGDGKVEIIASQYDLDSLSIFINDGAGAFTVGNSLPVGIHPYGCVSADFNRDGQFDLAVVNEGNAPAEPGSVSVILNTGDGSFAPRVDHPVQVDPLYICAADFNSDSLVDLVVTNFNSYSISYLKGNGDGTFQDSITFPACISPAGIASADFDNDGKLDVVLTSMAYDSIAILANLGDSFALPVSFQVGNHPIDVRVADFNEDSKPDLVTANNASSSISVLINSIAATCHDADFDGFGDPGYPADSCPVDNCPYVLNPDQADWNGDGIGDACTPTDTGTNVTIQPTANTTITFDSVGESGTTGVENSASGPYPPTNFAVLPLGSPIYYHITSTVTFTDTVTICITYADSDVVGDEEDIRMMHYVGTSWVDITSSCDTAANTICGKTTSFSYFALIGPCCVGKRGNIDGDPGNSVDIADLTALIDNLYIAFTPLSCQEAADVAPHDGTVDIEDLSRLIDFLYITFTPLAPCP